MADDLDEFVERYHRAVEAFIQGDPLPQERIWSRRDDVTLANPLGPPARGWTAVLDSLRHAGSQLSDGEVLAVERVSGYSSGDLAYILEIEQDRVRLGGAGEPADVSLRVTTISRREEDSWKVLHRHADPQRRNVRLSRWSGSSWRLRLQGCGDRSAFFRHTESARRRRISKTTTAAASR